MLLFSLHLYRLLNFPDQFRNYINITNRFDEMPQTKEVGNINNEILYLRLSLLGIFNNVRYSTNCIFENTLNRLKGLSRGPFITESLSLYHSARLIDSTRTEQKMERSLGFSGLRVESIWGGSWQRRSKQKESVWRETVFIQPNMEHRTSGDEMH